MKEFYRLNAEDKQELYLIFMASEEIVIEYEPVIVRDGEKERVCYKVEIDGKKTMFTERLYKWLLEKDILEKV